MCKQYCFIPNPLGILNYLQLTEDVYNCIIESRFDFYLLL